MEHINLDECPVCKSLGTVEIEDMTTDGHDGNVRCRCEKCDEVWVDVYSYRRTVVIGL